MQPRTHRRTTQKLNDPVPVYRTGGGRNNLQNRAGEAEAQTAEGLSVAASEFVNTQTQTQTQTHTHTHTHTHNRLTAFVRDNPSRPVPEETLTHSHPT